MADNANILFLRLIDDGFINFRSEKRSYLDEVVAFSFRISNSGSSLGLCGNHDAIWLFPSGVAGARRENCRGENFTLRALLSQDQLFRSSDHETNCGDAVSDHHLELVFSECIRKLVVTEEMYMHVHQTRNQKPACAINDLSSGGRFDSFGISHSSNSSITHEHGLVSQHALSIHGDDVDVNKHNDLWRARVATVLAGYDCGE